jgi:DNA repair protein RadC
MSTYPVPPELQQLPLIGVDDSTGSFELRRRKKKVEVTLARIRQLRDDLNAQLSCHPGQRPSIHNPAEAAALMDCFIGALDHEELWIVNLDTRHHVMSLVKLATKNSRQLNNSRSATF